MGRLEDDLAEYAHETFTKGDIMAGLKLIGEISGIVMLAGLAFTAITVWLPGLNIVIPTAVLVKGLTMAAKEYSRMNADDRKKIRAVASLLKGGVHKIGDIFID